MEELKLLINNFKAGRIRSGDFEKAINQVVNQAINQNVNHYLNQVINDEKRNYIREKFADFFREFMNYQVPPGEISIDYLTVSDHGKLAFKNEKVKRWRFGRGLKYKFEHQKWAMDMAYKYATKSFDFLLEKRTKEQKLKENERKNREQNVSENKRGEDPRNSGQK